MNVASSKRIICVVADPILGADQWRSAVHMPTLYEIRHFSQLTDLFAYTRQTREYVTAFICEMKIFLKASIEEKNYIAEMLDYFPLLRINTIQDPRISGGPIVATTPEEFKEFYKRIEKVPARGIRKYRRIPFHINLQICTGPKWDPSRSFNATTRDLSTGGCFAVDTNVRVPMQEIWVKFSDGPNLPPINSKVSRYTPWGKNSQSYPGWGLEFLAENSNLTIQWLAQVLGALSKHHSTK